MMGGDVWSNPMGAMMSSMMGMGKGGKGMGKSMGKSPSPSPMAGKGMSKGNMVWQPQFMKNAMSMMGKGMM